MVVVESAGITDVGMKRKGNEDSLLIDHSLNLYLVADGMGGHNAGEVASHLAVETIQNYMERFKAKNDIEELEDSDATLSKEANRLLSSIHLANRGVHQVSNSKDAYQGMGTTVSAVHFTEKTLIAANVGDSPIYLVHDGNIELLSVPHTVVGEHAAIDPEGAEQLSDKFKHILTQAIGVRETVNPDVCEIQCFRGDLLIISSDGLSDKVYPEEIFQIVTTQRPNKACRTLVDLANERGGDDNTTVIVLRVKKVYNSNKIINLINNFFTRMFKGK